MTGAQDRVRAPSPFTRGTTFAVVIVGFMAFLAVLYFLAAGDTGPRGDKGEAHAAATGLNGYAGLVRLLRSEGHEVSLSREPGGLDTPGLLVLTPPSAIDANEFAEILQNRAFIGPTLVIVPKWIALPPPDDLDEEVADRFEKGWVRLTGAVEAGWLARLPDPLGASHSLELLGEGHSRQWTGLGWSGELPTRTLAYVADRAKSEVLVRDAAGHALAYSATSPKRTEFGVDAHPVLFVVEPDLVNNFGLADSARADAALSLVRAAGYGDDAAVTFDLTLNGFGGAMNLLTLAFQPPFLAATLCLLLALAIIAWRAFMRFGPVAAASRDIAFGKSQLVANGAALIVRARRLRLLTAPYAALAERRIAARLGLARHDETAIDTALAARMPGEEPFSTRAQRLRDAHSATEILRAASALKDLEGKIGR